MIGAQRAAGGIFIFGLWESTVGKKFVMALSGAVLFGYVVLHLWGNLKVFAGPGALNGWGAFLRVAGNPVFGHEQLLWLARAALGLCLVLHVVAAAQLARHDRAARPRGYARTERKRSTYASRTMRWSGVFILLFVVYHVLDLTTGTLHPSNVAPFHAGQPYANVVGDFRNWFIALIYLLAVGLLGLHLNHGIWSFFQTLGLTRSRAGRRLRAVATGVAVALTAGNVAIPLAVLARIVR